MAEFFQYLAEFLKAFFIDLGDFFYDWIVFKWTKVGDNFSNYNQIFQQYSANWGVGGWIFFVIWWIIVAGLLFGLGFLIYWLLKKYIKFYKREIEKDKL